MLKVLLFSGIGPLIISLDMYFLGNDVYVVLEFTPCTVIHDAKNMDENVLETLQKALIQYLSVLY